MNRFYCLVLFLLAGIFLSSHALAETAKGVVFNDANQNGKQDAGEKGIKGVSVSNGREVVTTDKHGAYTIPVGEDTIVFVIKPSGWRFPMGPGNTVSRFYYTHKPAGSPAMKYAGTPPTGPLPASIDFPMYRRHEARRFEVICLGDTQTRDVQEVHYLGHDILEDLIGAKAAFGVTLGDVVFNDLSVFPQIIPAMSNLDIPWYYVPGNHDHNHDSPVAESTDDTFESYFGPSYYAYNYGAVHFIVLNDIRYAIGEDKYHGGLGEQQLAFIKNDLSHLSRNTLVVLMMHIPINELEDCRELYRLLADFPHTFSLSAHTHTQQHLFIDRAHGWLQDTPHHHLVHATACGSWWSGTVDERNIPITTMSDGVPNGYSIITFDKNRYSVAFHAAHEPADYQMNIALPESIAAADLGRTEAIVNVFAGSKKSSVTMQCDGKGAFLTMAPFTGKDPNYSRLYEKQKTLQTLMVKAVGGDPADKKDLKQAKDTLDPYTLLLPEPHNTPHLWKGPLPGNLAPGQHCLVIRTTDMFGKRYEAKRIFTVTP